MRFIAKRFRGRSDMWSSDEIDGKPHVLTAVDYRDAIAKCKEAGLSYCHPLTDEPKVNGGYKERQA